METSGCRLQRYADVCASGGNETDYSKAAALVIDDFRSRTSGPDYTGIAGGDEDGSQKIGEIKAELEATSGTATTAVYAK